MFRQSWYTWQLYTVSERITRLLREISSRTKPGTLLQTLRPIIPITDAETALISQIEQWTDH